MLLKIGTRGSELALTQANTIACALKATGHDTELVIIHTSGDLAQTATFGSIGAQGVFVREIEHALLRHEVDLAVHSFKDLPSRSPPELVVAAIPARCDPADLLILRDASCGKQVDALMSLPSGARVGTSSARRQAWLTHFKPGVRVEALRGNLPTRLKKLRAGDYEAILLAAAGIERLRGAGDLLDSALDGAIIERLDPQVFVPAPAQGALALQCRIDDAGVREILARLDDPKSRAEVTAERDALARAEGGCDTAFGAYCEAGGLGYQLTVMLERAGEVRSVRIQSANSDTLGARAWAELINA